MASCFLATNTRAPDGHRPCKNKVWALFTHRFSQNAPLPSPEAELYVSAMENSSCRAPAGKVWYFAFGSNMMSSVISNRGIKPLAEQIVVVPTHALTFDVFGVPYNEPAMASIAKMADLNPSSSCPAVHGVAYLLTQEEYVRLIVSEGAGIAYREAEVEAAPLEIGTDVKTYPKTIPVHTLVARYPFRPNAAPSERYLDRLIQGAEEHNLPASYQGYLKSIRSFNVDNDLSPRGRMGAKVFLPFWLSLITYLMRWIKVRAKSNGSGRAPEWMGSLIWALFGTMWLYHDHIHSKLWGRGDGDRLNSYQVNRLEERRKIVR